MILLASLAAAVLVYLVIGRLVGVEPRRQHRETHRPDPMARAQEWLVQADVQVGPVAFVAVSVGSGAVMGLAVASATGVGALGFVAGVGTSLMPKVVFARRRRAVRSDRLAAWPDALRDVVTHLRASMSVHASLVELGRSGPTPLRDVFARYERLAGALDHRSALEVAREELADPLSDRIIEVLLVAFEQGSSVVIDVLEELATSTTSDLQLLEEIETAQLETKLEARGATVMPFGVLAMLCITSEGYQSFYRTSLGWAVILFGAAMAAVGVVVISRLGRIPTERRILAQGGRS